MAIIEGWPISVRGRFVLKDHLVLSEVAFMYRGGVLMSGMAFMRGSTAYIPT